MGSRVIIPSQTAPVSAPEFDPEKPSISVLMPVFNVEPFIERAIMSILDQTYQDLEFVIVDDGSTDATPLLALRYAAKDRRVRFFRKPHGGIVSALNFGIDRCRAPLIARQDGDDWSLPDRLEKQIQRLEEEPGVHVVSSALIEVEVDGAFRRVLRYPHEPTREQLLERCCVPHAPALIRAGVFRRIGRFDPLFDRNCCEDYDFWLRCIEHFRIRVLDEPLYVRRDRPGSNIARARKTWVPIYDELARQRARERMDHVPPLPLASCR